MVPPDHCAEIAAGCKLVVKAAIDDHECFALADFPVHNSGQVNSCLAHEPAAEFNGEFACLQYRWPLLQCFMERRTDFFDVQRHVARKIGNTEATAQINERRASVCFLGQSCGKPQRRTLSINNGVGVQSLRSGKNVKPDRTSTRLNSSH